MKLDKNIDKITIKGARTHNLKNISVEMPRNKMIVITGVSGSGSLRLPSILSLPKGRGDTLNPSLLTRDNF
jgi:ABC-type lipoprotein export system ATPase subunit